MSFDFSLVIVPCFAALIVLIGLVRRVNVYDEFVAGAKSGLPTVVRILPFVVGMLFAVDIFTASGCFELLAAALRPVLELFGIPPEMITLIVLRPFSGGASIAAIGSIFALYGADSRIGRISSTMLGSSETMFYTVALYCGSVGVTRTRYIIPVGIATDIVGIFASIWICDIMF